MSETKEEAIRETDEIDYEIINVEQWLTDNKDHFVPPVCNKLMHHGQLDIMFVGGSNIRKDFHLQQGEELFWQLKGHMNLVIEENGKHRDIQIEEGEIFLLPAKIPHSPRRSPGSMGLVIERKRIEGHEMDGLRYYCDDEEKLLYQKVFFCEDLGKELGPIIKGFFASDEYACGIPKFDSVDHLPWEIDSETINPAPLNFKQWIEDNAEDDCGVEIFGEDNQMSTVVYQNGKFVVGEENGTHQWVYQLEGYSEVENGQKLEKGDSILFTEEQTILSVTGILLAISQTAPSY